MFIFSLQSYLVKQFYYLFFLVLFFSLFTTTSATATNEKIISCPDLNTETEQSYIKQIDLINELKIQQHSNQRSYYGLLLDQQRNILHLSSTEDDNIDSINRQIRLNDNISRRAIEIISNSNDVTFLITLKQHRHNAGVIFAFTNGIHRILEIQSSSRRKELRFHYRINDTIYSESFDVDIVDDKWHKIALTISYSQLDLHIDCIHRFRRTIQPLDRYLFAHNKDNNITLWLGQRGPNHFVYKGYIGDLRIISSANGFRIQCPSDLGAACPTCGQFKELKDSINYLENTVKYLTEKLLMMEQRLSNREQQCECLRSCYMNGTKYMDGNEWISNDNCHRCRCSAGSIACYPMTACQHQHHESHSLQKVDSNIPSSLLLLPNKSEKNSSSSSPSTSSSSSRCLYNKKIYYEGESIERWTNKNQPNRAKCFECVCRSRSMRCKEKHCPVLNCPPSKRIQPDDKCCMICETDFCSLGHDCHPMAECHNLATNYTCHCKPGFKGNGHTCQDIDECNILNDDVVDDRITHHKMIEKQLNNNVYRHKCNTASSICVNKPGSYECQCKSGFIPQPDNQYECIDIDECLNGQNNCSQHAICLNQPGSYQCQCKPGYEGDGINCKPVCKDLCLNGGHCQAPDTCSCRKGYYGHRCEEDIDECELDIHQCPKNSKCINKLGWYRCECNQGYEDRKELSLNDDEFSTFDFECRDINECIDPLLNTCPSNSKCINIEGTYRCDCNIDGNNHTFHFNANISLTDSICPKTCIVNGMERKHNERWPVSSKDPCTICQCVQGVVSCQLKQCDCSQKNSIDSQCCPECHINSDEKVCYHQENHHRVYKNGERWTYECETCECMNGEIDCWSECPQINCLNAVRIPGDCCLRCEDDPCQSSSKSDLLTFNNFTGLAGCRHQDRHYRSGEQIDSIKDKCATCSCQNGRLCCSYSYPCLNELTNHDYSRSSSIMTDKTAAISRSTGDIASNDVDDDDDDDGRKQHGNGEYMQSSIDDDSHNSELLKPFMNSLIGHEQESMEKFSKILSDKNAKEFDDRDNSIDNHDIDNDDFSLSSSNTNIIHMNQPLTIKQKSTNSIDKIYDKNNDAIDNDWSHEMASN
uniref:Protein kinase C-binding protein NELL2-like n=1 Tax=Dermatophagoides pteronyssinus TaxID=6956 RepID=A0A6P6YHM0_DERPT|nr:protein kinase C-binding protein NELL2-like [Dermatophagoides pteronyssinus]